MKGKLREKPAVGLMFVETICSFHIGFGMSQNRKSLKGWAFLTPSLLNQPERRHWQKQTERSHVGEASEQASARVDAAKFQKALIRSCPLADSRGGWIARGRGKGGVRFFQPQEPLFFF